MSMIAGGLHAHSGKLGNAALLVPVAGVAAAVVLGFAYAYVDIYSPVAGYISIFFALAFTFGLGWTVAAAGMAAKCRSATFLRATGLVVGLLGLYVAWVAFEYALFRSIGEPLDATPLDLFLAPVAVWEIARGIAETGWYSIRSFTPQGMVLWAFWAIEAAIVVAGTTLLATRKLDDGVFCEACDAWCGYEKGAARLAMPEEGSLLETLRTGQSEVLTGLTGASEWDSPQLRVDAWECGGCGVTAALRVQVVELTEDDEGERKETEEELTGVLAVSRDFVRRLKEAKIPEVA